MKIVKLINMKSGYFVVFDCIPQMTYEKIGNDYVGSATDDHGNIIFSRRLGKERYNNAFGGRELTLKMKDGSVTKIKDYWFDSGSYKPHGEFIHISASTLKDLQDCYVYCSYNINKSTFQAMVDTYLKTDILYEYYEIEEWCDLQYDWYPLIVGGTKYPFVINKTGTVRTTDMKHKMFPLMYMYKRFGDKTFKLKLFNLEYNNGERLIKVQAKYDDVLKESLQGAPCADCYIYEKGRVTNG